MSICNSQSKLLRNKAKYNHDKNLFEESSPKFIKEKRKYYKNNDIDPHLANEFSLNIFKQINNQTSFSNNDLLQHKPNLIKSTKKVILSDISVKDNFSNKLKSFDSDILTKKQNESLSLIITSNKHPINTKNNNIITNKDINYNFNSNNNSSLNGNDKIRKSKSSEKLSNSKANINNNNNNNNNSNESFKHKIFDEVKDETIQYIKYSNYKQNINNENFLVKKNITNLKYDNNKKYKINFNYHKDEYANDKGSYIDSAGIISNSNLNSSKNLFCRSDGFMAKANLQIKTTKFMINKNKRLNKNSTSKSKQNTNDINNNKNNKFINDKKESEKFVNCHYKKSIINNYFEKKESEKNLSNKNSDLKLKKVNNKNNEKEEGNKEVFLTSSKFKSKEKENGFFMLKKDYYMQNLIEKNSNTTYKDFIDESSMSNPFKFNFRKNNKINFGKIIIKNKFHNNNERQGIRDNNNNIIKNNMKSKNNFFSTSINIIDSKSKFRLKSSKDYAIRSPLLIKEEKMDPKIFKETISVRNFSNYKIITNKQPENIKFIRHHRKEISAGAYSQNSSNYMYFDSLSAKGRNCRSALRPFNMTNSLSMENKQTNKIQNNNLYNIKNKENDLKEALNISKENDPKNASFITARNNINMHIHLSIKNNNYNKYNETENNYSNVFYFDKASKLNYYHARELSAFSRKKRKKKIFNEENHFESNNNSFIYKYRKKKGFNTSLNLKILNFKNCELNKKPLLTIRPYNLNEKIFSNDFIKGNLHVNKDLGYYGNNLKTNEKLTIETIRDQDKEDIDKAACDEESNIKVNAEENNDNCEVENCDKNEIDHFNDLNSKSEKNNNENSNIKFKLNDLQQQNINEEQYCSNFDIKSDFDNLKFKNEYDSNKTLNINDLMNKDKENNNFNQSNFHRIKNISINKNRKASASNNLINKNNPSNNQNNNSNYNIIVDNNYTKINNLVSREKEVFRTKRQIDNLYEMLSAKKKGKSNAIEYANASNSLIKHMKNKLINPDKSTTIINNYNKDNANSKSINKHISLEKTDKDKDEELNQQTKENKVKEALNDLIKSNAYLDSDQFILNSTNENRKEEKEKNNNISHLNSNLNRIGSNQEKRKTIKVDRGLQSDFNYVTNKSLQKLRRLKLQSANKVQRKDGHFAYDELKKINLNDFDLNDYLYSKNIDCGKIINFNSANRKQVPKSAIGFSNQRSIFNNGINNYAYISKPPPNSFRNIFTHGKIKLSTMILSNIKV